jgi:hypothetical protein
MHVIPLFPQATGNLSLTCLPKDSLWTEAEPAFVPFSVLLDEY